MLKRYSIVFITFFLQLHCITGANYYWVGNTGNWNDLAHWASSSGGAGNAYGTAPTANDNVFFDANSFSSGSQTVTINANASCANINFTGVANTPTLAGTNSFSLTCAGSLTFVAGMTYTFAGDVNFTGTGVHTVTSAGKSFLRNVLFNGTGGQWTLQDALTVSNQLGLQAGTLIMNGVAVSTATLSANVSGDVVRAINFGASLITVTGAGTCIDFRGNTTNLTLTVGTSTISCTTTSNLAIQTGTAAKSIPHLIFPNITTGNIAITTGNAANRITFGDIIKVQAAPSLSSNGSTGAFTLTGPTMNTFGNISFPNNTYITIRNRDGTSYGNANRSIYTGTVSYGNGCKAYHYGSYTNYTQDVTFGTGVDMYYQDRTEYDGTFTIGSSSGYYALEFRNGAQFDGPVVFQGSSRMQFYNNTIDFNSTLTTNSYGTFYLYYLSNATVNFNGNILVGNQTLFNIGNGGNGTTNINSTLTLNTSAQLEINNGTSTTTINNLTLNSYCAVSFNSTGANSITGTLSATSNCNDWTVLRSNVQATQASVSFSSAQVVTGCICQSVNVTTSNLTNNNGSNMGNNSGITFGSPVSGNTLYWVGNTTGNTKTGTHSTGVNHSWSNPDNWSLTSGIYSGTNSCIPNAVDHIVFNAASFSAGAANVDMDLTYFFCNDMTWTGIPAGVTLDTDSTSPNRTLFVFGNLAWGGSNMTNSFEGTTVFSATDVTPRTITNNGTRFAGGVIFDYLGGSWTTADNMDIQGDGYGDLTVRNGTISVGNNNITLDDDWNIAAGGTYTCTAGGNATVTFDGANAVGDNYITVAGTGNFNNITINRGGAGSGVKLASPITVGKNFTLTRGYLYDEGNQITGNATGVFSMGKYGNMNIGTTGLSTLFPTNYIASNIVLDPDSWIKYNSSINQTVSGVPDYGALFLSNTTASLKTKTLTEDVVVQTYLMIDDYNNFADNGYQISFDAVGTNILEMDPNSKLTLGSASSASLFPLNYTTIDFDHSGNGSTVIYNGGSAQTIEGLSGASNASYSHLQLSQPGVGSVTKTLNANTIIRGNIIIDADNVLDASGSGYTVTLGGNWTNNGTFTEQNSTVIFNGTTTQTINAGNNTETFYNITFNNTNATGISIVDDIVVTNTVTFTDGIVTPAAAEIFHINDNATASGANNASYVDGKVRKIGDDAFIFPVGDDGYYAPIEISAPSINTDHFTAQYINTDPNGSYSAYSKDVTLDHISRCEYWTLDRTNGSSNVSVTLSWDTRSCVVTNMPSLAVARWDGAQWKDHGSGGTTGNNAAGTITSNGVVSSFSPFTLASLDANNPLPISLITFSATPVNNKQVKVFWQTASEINNDYFNVQRSLDALEYEDIGIVDGAGNSSSVISYQLLDNNFPTLNFSTLYYRLKQTDFDDAYSYSNIVAVNLNNSSSFSVYPNPSSNGKFSISFAHPEQTKHVEVRNALGEIILNLTTNHSAENISISTSGIYFLTCYDDFGNIQNHKIIVE